MDQNQIFLLSIAVLLIVSVASLILGFLNRSKINTIMDYSEDGDLVENLDRYYNNIRELQKKLKNTESGAMSDRITLCEQKFNMSFSKSAIVNFDAFEGVHGKQSFALAVLNMYNDGFIITSLYGNSSSNTYIRPVTEGKSSVKLLTEESEALSKAMTANIN